MLAALPALQPAESAASLDRGGSGASAQDRARWASHSRLMSQCKRLIDLADFDQALKVASRCVAAAADCDGRAIGEAHLLRSQVLTGLRRYDDAAAACQEGAAACPVDCATALELAVSLAALKTFQTDAFSRTLLACRKPMSYSKNVKVDFFLTEIPLADRRIYVGGKEAPLDHRARPAANVSTAGPSLVSKEGFMRRKQRPASAPAALGHRGIGPRRPPC
ncbi:hypothetical protein M885DRAFT_620701 [Pelagophyceae sp. CCMP2097]|nr:hypothetical protein M885DRAFT_620701 [Pelagophyceae sp. CCMP2097]